MIIGWYYLSITIAYDSISRPVALTIAGSDSGGGAGV